MLAEPDPTIGLVGLVPFVGALVGLVFIWLGQLPRAVTTLGATAAVFVLWMFAITVPQADRFQNSQAFIAVIERLSQGPANVSSFRYFRPSMVFYGHQPVSKLWNEQEVADFFDQHPKDAFLYTMEEQMSLLAPCLPRDVAVVESHRRLVKGGKVLLLGRPSDEPRWQAGGARSPRLGRTSNATNESSR